MVTYHSNGFGGWVRASWPDGRATLEQPMIAVQAFSIVMSALAFAQQETRG